MKPHVLRYWESRFPALAPPKNRSGNRVYRGRDIELIALLRHLVHEERCSLEGVEGSAGDAAMQALERSFVRSLRAELETVMELLDAGEG